MLDEVDSILGEPDVIPNVSDAVLVSILSELVRRRSDVRLAASQRAVDFSLLQYREGLVDY